ncbi:hypothetical protein [Fusobacterium russii]|uniref:hypothetical protein n=1 Tax=Fusobacterium russii TaxID=854 RepID=UPI0003A6CD3F|nr:hypothetical protein [Fusobacterium russii]
MTFEERAKRIDELDKQLLEKRRILAVAESDQIDELSEEIERLWEEFKKLLDEENFEVGNAHIF